MKILVALLPLALLTALLLTVLPTAVQAGDDFFPYPTHVETLDNGLQVILVPMPSDGLVSYWSIVKTGSRDEYEANRTGFAHFFEHMMFRGTERFPQDVYNNLVTEIGADNNAFTSNDLTAYNMSITNADLELVVDIESDRFLNLDYPKAAFRTEAGAVHGEYLKNRSSPFFTIVESLRKTAFNHHTYRHLTIGYEADILLMPELYDYSRQFFERYYRPDNIVLLISGDIDIESTRQLIKKHYGDWQPGYRAPEIAPEPEQQAERRTDVTYEGNTLPLLWMGYKAPAFDPSDRTWVAASLYCDLAFGETSEIFNKLVLEEQAVEFIQAGLDISRDPDLLDIIARVKDPAKLAYVEREIDRVISKAQLNPPDAGRLADLKSRLRYSFLMNLDTPAKVNRSLARMIATAGSIDSIETFYQTLESLTPEDLQQAAQKILVSEHRTVATLQGDS